MAVDYKHSDNIHTLAGPKAALPLLFPQKKPQSLLDVGCGTGTWLRAALDFGIQDVLGVDGAQVLPSELHIPPESILHRDLSRALNLDKRFNVVLCFEVAEHLESVIAPILIDGLVKHSDLIYFSAACPGQKGQHHVNCQWPAYWQRLFNDLGYVCQDAVRWRIWETEAIEPWYRQNMFTAVRAEDEAGKEPRILPVIHSQMLPILWSKKEDDLRMEHLQCIEEGQMSAGWYANIAFHALSAKAKRKLNGHRRYIASHK